MTMRVIEGFDWCPTSSPETALVRSGWNTHNTSAGMLTPGRLNYGNALTVGINNSAGHNGLIKAWAPSSDIVFIAGGMYRNNSSVGNWGPQLSVGEIDTGNGLLHICIRLVGFGRVAVYRATNTGSGDDPFRNATWTQIGISDPSLYDMWSWVWIEARIKIGMTDGEVEVRLNGKTIIDLVDTQTQNSNGLPYVNCGGPGAGGSSDLTSYVDDFAIWDDAGTINNDWLGTNRIKAMAVIADGSNIDSIIGGSSPALTNWQSVLMGKSFDDTKYVYVPYTAPGDYDLYDMDPNISAPIVHALQIRVVARQDDATQLVMRTLLKSGATTTEGADEHMSQTYNAYFGIYETNPDTGFGWTQSEVNAIEVGYKLQSVEP